MQNIEIKVPLDNPASVERRLYELGARRVWRRRQRDTFFAVESGWLKLREAGGQAAELISYRRDTTTADPRPSDYDVQTLADPESWQRLLGRVLPVRGVVAKTRTLWLLRHTRVHVDEVRGLGSFLELETVLDGIDAEAGRREADDLIDGLDLDRSRFVPVPYLELLLESGRIRPVPPWTVS